jgi:hypothetical protein
LGDRSIFDERSSITKNAQNAYRQFGNRALKKGAGPNDKKLRKQSSRRSIRVFSIKRAAEFFLNSAAVSL